MKKNIVLLALFSCIITFSYLLFTQRQAQLVAPNEQASITVTLTKDGFQPAELTVKKGQSVTFVSANNAYFWPASDLHPTHELYSDFDPQEPIAPTDHWTFRFTKTGTFKYHDHLAPYYTGTITVELR